MSSTVYLVFCFVLFCFVHRLDFFLDFVPPGLEYGFLLFTALTFFFLKTMTPELEYGYAWHYSLCFLFVCLFLFTAFTFFLDFDDTRTGIWLCLALYTLWDF